MNNQKKKGISHKGKGKWQTYRALSNYRKIRDKAKKLAKKSRENNA